MNEYQRIMRALRWLLLFAVALAAAAGVGVHHARAAEYNAEWQATADEVTKEYTLPCMIVVAVLGGAETMRTVHGSELLRQMREAARDNIVNLADLSVGMSPAERKRQNDRALAECVRQAVYGEKP